MQVDVIKELDMARKRAAQEAILRAEAVARGFEYAGPDGSPLIEEVAAGPPFPSSFPPPRHYPTPPPPYGLNGPRPCCAEFGRAQAP